MSKKKTQIKGKNRPRRREILVFAEDKHDSDAIKCLAEALNPRLRETCTIVVQRDPSSLTRSALPATTRSWLEKISDVVGIRSMVAEIVAVLVHQDADGPIGAYENEFRAKLRRDISTIAHPVIPVQEMEAWWMLYPNSFRAVKPSAWRDVKLPKNSDLETIANPKEYVIARTRSVSPKDQYAEADSLAVATKMAAAIAEGASRENTASSWTRFSTLIIALDSAV